MNSELMKTIEGIKYKVLMWIGIAILFNFLNVQNIVAQAPDCEQCNDLIDDPAAYAECVEEFCGVEIPIDSDVWVLIVGGLAMGTYSLYRFNAIPKIVKA